MPQGRVVGPLVWLMVLAAGAAGLGAVLDRAGASRAVGPLPIYGRVPEFACTAQDGTAFTPEDMAGRVWLVDFIFTRCAGQCPILSARMADLQATFEEREGMRLVSFTVDPEYDTPERLTAYAARYGAKPGRWWFVTGTPQAIQDLVREGFRLAMSQEGSDLEPVTHSNRLVLVDHAGRIRGYYEATDEQAMARLRPDAARLLEEAGG